MVCLEAGLDADGLGFQFEEGAEVEYLDETTFYFVFGVEYESGANRFLVEVQKLTAEQEIRVNAPNAYDAFETSSIRVQLADGTVDLNARVSVRFDEAIKGDGRVTLSELRTVLTSQTPEDFTLIIPAGTLFPELPLKTERGLNPGELSTYTPYIYASSGTRRQKGGYTCRR